MFKNEMYKKNYYLIEPIVFLFACNVFRLDNYIINVYVSCMYECM